MEPVVWPERKCRETVWKGDTAHACEVVEQHPGPCASFSHAESVQRRDAWEKANPNWKRDMRTDPFVD
jgi:hypothetical protein